MGRVWNTRTRIHDINRAFKRYHEYDTEGVVIPWYHFDSVSSQRDDIYDEGNSTQSRRWYLPPPLVPILFIDKMEGGQEVNDTGLYSVDKYHLSVGKQALLNCGINADRVQQLLNDRFVFEGHVFAIDDAQQMGRLGYYETILGIRGTQIKNDELINDPDFQQYIDTDVI